MSGPCLNDRPVALTSVVMTCFERLIKDYIRATLPHLTWGCVLSPIMYSLYTHDCVARSSSNNIVKFADDTVVVGLISGNDEKAYLEEAANLSLWCQDNSLMLNVCKTKELIVDFRRTQHQDNIRGLTHHWGLMGLLWRGWAASGTWEST